MRYILENISEDESTTHSIASDFLKQSKDFYIASDRAREVRLTDESRFECTPITASVVCLAFSIELALKALIRLENQSLKFEHKFDALFKLLSEGSQSAIKKIVTLPKYPKYKPERQFEDWLEAHSKSFVDWRYACEPKAQLLVADLSFLDNLVTALHQLIEIKLDDWNQQ